MLDLGTATESGARTRVLNRSHLAGTPLYIAPEQLRGARATVQSDLYAVGVMLYGALAGRPPHRADNLSALIHGRLSAPAPSLREAVPEAPVRVAEVVDRLLSLDPNARPGSAVETADLLRGERGGGIRFPRLGGPSVLDELRAAAAEGRAVDLFGREGAGHTRCLEDLASLLDADGRVVVRLVPGENPFESLAALLGGLEDLEGRTFAEAQEEIDRHVETALTRGTVVLADDPETLDEWTRRGLSRWRSAGCVIRARIGGMAPPEESVLTPLAADELKPLFKGSERLFHLRHDAACELFRRTGGLPARVVEEVDGWVRAGLARWESGVLAITRAAVDRLRTGLRVTPPPLAPARSSTPRPGGEIEDVLGLLVLAGSPLSTPAGRSPGKSKCAVDGAAGPVS